MFANALVLIRHQGISNHDADTMMISVPGIVLFHKDFSPSGEQLEHHNLAHEL